MNEKSGESLEHGGHLGPGSGEDYAGLLIDRLASAIIDESLPLKEVERELRGCVADVAVHRRGLAKREAASRCGVTEKSIENYLKDVRPNPKSREREIARVLQDEMLSLEEIYARVRPVLCSTREFRLDDAKRSLEKLVRTGEVLEYPGCRYRAVDRPSIRYPRTLDAHREVVSQKARDLDYIVLRQKEATEDEAFGPAAPGRGGERRYSRVVGDTNLVRIDFTVGCPEKDLPAFYEELSEGIAKLTMKYEKRRAKTRVRLLFGMRTIATILAIAGFLFLCAAPTAVRGEEAGDDESSGGVQGSWELDDAILRDGQPAAPGEGGDIDAPRLLRGDLDGDERIQINDAIILTRFLNGDDVDVTCLATADANDDGRVDRGDPLWLFHVLFGSPSGVVRIGETVPPEDLERLGCERLHPRGA